MYSLARLPAVSFQGFKAGVGILLIGQLRFQSRWGGRNADAAVGLGGGVLGGLAGLSGPLLDIWAGLRGWGKDEKRGVFQACNLSILAFAFVSQ